MPKQRNIADKGRRLAKRRTNVRSVLQSFLIVCLGTETERNYFNKFKARKDIKIVTRDLRCDPVLLVDKAESFLQNDEYDQVWCVFDCDEFPVNNLNRALEKAEQLGFHVAYSNQAFELWFLLHYRYSTAPIHRKDYSKELSSYLQFEYDKSYPDMYDLLLSKQDNAIYHAKLLREYHRALGHNPFVDDNPYTNVYQLVEQLKTRFY